MIEMKLAADNLRHGRLDFELYMLPITEVDTVTL